VCVRDLGGQDRPWGGRAKPDRRRQCSSGLGAGGDPGGRKGHLWRGGRGDILEAARQATGRKAEA